MRWSPIKVAKPGLAGWLAIVTTSLVTLAVGGMSLAGVRLLRDLAAAEALTRVELGVAAAREALRQATDDLLTSARVLGARPTLQALLRGSGGDAMEPYLRQYCEGAELDACAVVRNGEVLVATGRHFAWTAILAGAGAQGDRFLVAAAAQGLPVAGARVTVAANEGTSVFVGRVLDDAFAERLTERAGLEVRLVDGTSPPSQSDAFAALDAQALASGTLVGGNVEALGVYAASLPVRASTGETIALLRAVLPERDVIALVDEMTRRILVVAVAVALLATTSGILVGNYWIAGVRRLTDAARRIGSGNLMAPIPGEGSNELGFLAKTMEEMRHSLVELQAARRTRDSVLANIAHEFRTPLAAQLASIELLHDGLGTMPLAQQRELVASLERGSQRLAWFIDNLLESVRIEAGQLAIRRQEIALDDVIAAARELIEPLLEQRGQRLAIGFDGELPMIRGDHQRLTQVVVNLLANASKFGPPNSTIRIGSRADGAGGLMFWVDDEGPGPADATDNALFERFRRSGGEDPAESGLGLGLYIVRSIVERHGGRVSLTRTADNWTRAQVNLPGQPSA